MNKVILTVGLPRSGKSTWAKKQKLPIVNRDSIRLAIHGQPFIGEAEDLVSYVEEKMIKSLFNAGNNVIIIDATHLKWKYISRWEEKYDVEIKYFYTPVDVCKRRASETRKEYLIPVIDRMINETDIKSMQDFYSDKKSYKAKWYTT